jgi:hypothetical protein
MLRELLCGEQMGKGTLGAARALKDKIRDDLRFEGLKRRGPFRNLLECITDLGVA